MFSSLELVEYTENKIYANVSSIKRKSGHKLNFRCPICGDSQISQKKMRGWFNLRSGTYRCYNGGCSAKSSLSGLKFLSLLENKSIDDIKKEYLSEFKSKYNKKDLIQELLKSTSNISTSAEITPINNISVSIPNTWVDINKNKYVEEYIKSRCIYEAPFRPDNWKLYYELEKHKIVIPWIRNREMVYYQYRSLYKDDPVKYYFPSDMNKDIFGLDSIDENFKYIFLIEGVFDTIFVKNGICLGGVELTQYQQKLLERYQLTHKFVWLFDNQWTDTTSYNKSLERLQKNELIFIWPKSIKEKDVNEFYLKNNKDLSFSSEAFLISNIIEGGRGILKLKFQK